MKSTLSQCASDMVSRNRKRANGMRQQSLSDMEYSLRKRTTKREEFLNIMNEMIPRDECASYFALHSPLGSAVVRLWALKNFAAMLV